MYISRYAVTCGSANVTHHVAQRSESQQKVPMGGSHGRVPWELCGSLRKFHENIVGVLEGPMRAWGSHGRSHGSYAVLLGWYRHPSVSTIENIFECKNDYKKAETSLYLKIKIERRNRRVKKKGEIERRKRKAKLTGKIVGRNWKGEIEWQNREVTYTGEIDRRNGLYFERSDETRYTLFNTK